jgi:uncharacterized protein DUF6177
VPSARDIGLHFVVARRVAAHLGLDHALDAPVPLARPLGAQDRPAAWFHLGDGTTPAGWDRLAAVLQHVGAT